MAFEGLTERLQKTFAGLRKKGKITESDVRDAMREIRLALLEADVNLDVVRSFIKDVRTKAVGTEVLDGVNPSQQIVKIVNDELTKTMGESAVPLNKSAKIPTVIMMAGLQGAGKTTTVGKLAKYLEENQKARPLLIAADVYRPAAIKQLQVVGQQVHAPVFEMGTDTDPREIVRKGLEKAHEDHNDYVLIDTAGRLQIDEKLMQELADIKEIAKPDEILLVVDAMTGQAAVDVAKGFNEQLDITGVVLTKLDGDTRGGVALSIRAVTGKPIKFTGQGEKMDALDVFYPDRMANRILGMGDILTLVDKAQKNFDQKQAEDLTEKMQANTFDFNDFIAQMDQVSSMGPMEDLIKMIPGLASNPALKNVKIDPKDMAHTKAIVMSMTEQERTNPDLLNPSRRRRIAAGSGRPIVEVNRMIKQFNASKKMMNQMSKGNMSGMEKMMGGGVKGKLGKMAMGSMIKRQQKAKRRRLKKAKRFKS